MITSLLKNLRARSVVPPDEEKILRSIMVRRALFDATSDIVKEGSTRYATLILDGIAARYKLLSDGRRQFTALYIAGDFVDLHDFLMQSSDQAVTALSPCRVAFVEHEDLHRIVETQPHLTRLLWLLTVTDGAIHRERVAAMGRRSTKANLAHLFCELFVRLKIVGSISGNTIPFPITQINLADMLGISVVHTNKKLHKLREEGVLSWGNRRAVVLNWKMLEEIAEFKPSYLGIMDTSVVDSIAF